MSDILKEVEVHLAFLKSVILSGEDWTDTCEKSQKSIVEKLRAYQEQQEWKPIETAPKDKRVSVWTGQAVYAAHWAKNILTDDEAWIVAEFGDSGDQVLVRPILWKPLTAPPTEQEGG